MKKGSTHENVRTLIALLIVLIAFGIFLLFYNNAQYIMKTNQFTVFMTAATTGMGLLLALLFLVNKDHPASKAKTKKKKK